MSESLFEQYKAALRRGHMAALAGDLDAALAAYDAAARLVPERALPLASRGTVLHRLDRWPEAAEAFDQALQLAPDDEAALRARASARADRGLRSGAAADFERLAFVLDVAGRAAPAADAARHAAELEPSAARTALADRLGAAAAMLADLPRGTGLGVEAPGLEGSADVDATADAAPTAPPAAPPVQRPIDDGAAFDALAALRAGLDAAERGTAPGDAAVAEAEAEASADGPSEAPSDGSWPGIDLPSPRRRRSRARRPTPRRC